MLKLLFLYVFIILFAVFLYRYLRYAVLLLLSLRYLVAPDSSRVRQLIIPYSTSMTVQ